MKKYGLQLRIPPAPAQQKKPEASRPLVRPSVFGDDNEDDVEREISRLASKNKALQKIEEQHKKALEEDPSVFDYDGVYDEMKGQIARPRVQDQTERKSKYIGALKEISEVRKREQEIVYERKLLKERSKDDHLFADKEKFVTSAYKKKLAEQAQWLEEEKRRQIREEQEDVTKKSDLSDFYFGLNKNVAFGARLKEMKRPISQSQASDRTQGIEGIQSKTEAPVPSTQDSEEVDNRAETFCDSQNHVEHAVRTSEVTVVEAISEQAEPNNEQTLANQVSGERYKRSEDAVSAARERFLARKRAREQ